MTTGKFTLVIRWPSGQSTICGEMTDHQHGEICRILSPDYRAQPIQGGEAVEVVAWRVSHPDTVWKVYEKNPESWAAGDFEIQTLMTVAQHQRILAAAYQHESVVPVRVTGSLDEIDAQVWPFINAEAQKVGAEFGRIETYGYELANGGVVVLWSANKVHAMAVTIRDDANRTRCIRMLAETHPAAQVADGAVAVPRDKLQGLLWYADQLLCEVNAGARYSGCTAADAEHSDSDYLELSTLLANSEGVKS